MFTIFISSKPIGNGVKILTASTNMAPNTPVIECKGRLMLASQYKAPNKKQIQPPYVFHYHVGDVLEICLDGKTYGDYNFCYFKNMYFLREMEVSKSKNISFLFFQQATMADFAEDRQLIMLN